MKNERRNEVKDKDFPLYGRERKKMEVLKGASLTADIHG